MKDESTISQNPSITTKCNVDKRNKRNTNSTTVLWNILFRVLTFFMSIQLIVNWYYVFMHDLFLTEGLAYTLIFVSVIVLLSDLLIDDEEID